MPSVKRQASRRASLMTAFCGLIAALSVTLMLAGGIIPVATYCVPLAAGVLLLPVLLEFGKRAAWTTFASVAIISLFLGIDKEAAFFYLFLGYYPLIKWEIDRIQKKPLRILTKLFLYSVLIISMYIVLGFLMNMNMILQEFNEIGIVFSIALLLLFNICMLLYDRLLFPLVFLYANRVRPKLRFLIR